MIFLIVIILLAVFFAPVLLGIITIAATALGLVWELFVGAILLGVILGVAVAISESKQ